MSCLFAGDKEQPCCVLALHLHTLRRQRYAFQLAATPVGFGQESQPPLAVTVLPFSVGAEIVWFKHLPIWTLPRMASRSVGINETGMCVAPACFCMIVLAILTTNHGDNIVRKKVVSNLPCPKRNDNLLYQIDHFFSHIIHLAFLRRNRNRHPCGGNKS